jgi:hypothetical protein
MIYLAMIPLLQHNEDLYGGFGFFIFFVADFLPAGQKISNKEYSYHTTI